MDTSLLQTAIFECLLAQPRWKIHTLASYLEQKYTFPIFDQQPQLDLFKRNFLIMNALFVLNDELYHQGYFINISSLNISLHANSANIAPTTSTELRDYYLTWQNFNSDINTVNQLLTEFWQAFYQTSNQLTPSKQAIAEAYEFFALKPDCSFSQANKTWRILAFKYHPDKPSGNTEKFQQLQHHWQILKQVLR